MLLVSAFQRLSLSSTIFTRGIHTTNALMFRGTPVLCAEPLKKKKKIDPQILKAREERRRKKLEKAIRKLERNEKQLKPIEECEVPLTLRDEQSKRTRKIAPLPDEIKEQRAALIKEWCSYRNEQKIRDVHLMEMLNQSHMKALNELKAVSEDLYQEALQPDYTFIPFYTKTVVATPPIDNYESPDGEYIDVSKKWE